MADQSISFNIVARDMASGAFERVGASALTAKLHLDSLAKVAVGVGVAFGALAVVKGVFSTGIGEVKDYQAGLAQLQAGLKSTGGVAGLTSTQMENLASNIQNYSGQTDDSIVKTESLLLTFTNIRDAAGKNNDVFTQTTKIAADMAARLGGDASGAAIQLGKALNDPVKGITALTRVGVSFSDAQKKQITDMAQHNNLLGAQKVILGELNKEFGGSAKAYGETLPGQIERGKRAFEDFSQSVVGAAAPIATAFLPALTGVLDKIGPKLQSFASKVPEVVKVFTESFKSHGNDVTTQGFLGKIGTLAMVIRDGFDKAGRALHFFIEGFQNIDANWSSVPSEQRFLNLGNAIKHLFQDGLLPIFKDVAKFVKDDVAPSIGNLAVILQGPLQVAITAVVVAFRLAGAVLANVIGPALKSVTGWMKDHQAIVKAVALSVGTVVVAWKLWQGAILLWQAATKAAIAVQTAFNVVLDANPIGLVIVAIAGMAAGLIYAYKNCDGFRHVVQETFNWIRDHWKLLVQIIGLPMEPLIQLALHFTEFKRIAQEALRKVVDSFLDMVGAILHTAASMFGWVPKVGDHLKGARDAFDRFRDSVNASLGGIQSNKKITVTATAVLTDGSGAPISDTSGYSAYARAHKDGGPIFGPGSGTSDSIFARLSNGEYVVRAAQASQHRGLLDAINYGAPGFAQGGPVVVPNASAAMFARQTSAWDNSLGARVSGAFSGMLERFAASFSAGIGSGVQRWSGLVSQVLSMLGLSPGLLGKVLAQMTTESGGNVSAINLTDSNALAGHPSQGLMQVIPGTFAAYAGPYAGLGILNPLANVYAGLNYAMHRYGPGLAGLGEGHGYDSGGWLKPGVSLTYNGTGKPEAVLTSEQWRSVRSGGHTFVIQTMDAASLQQWINRPGNPGILIDAMDRHKGRGSSVPAWMS